ncbi:hypothetical protein [Chitinophaga sp. Cy-1792]|uniref:hypothetical protein n=1 Tax=Chitinophaga sp. Cy-1792 TaxID=2608339 RepID=UPI00141E83B0|nr:hypothetical protein [Chitinophaga sp. Cy-1792]NIG54733.1 hypothetical protein [Chitinophaga sp. Cy-1792]
MKYGLLLLPIALAACSKVTRSVQQTQSTASWAAVHTTTTSTKLDTLVEIKGDSMSAILDLGGDSCSDSLVERKVEENGLHLHAVFNTRTKQLQAKIYTDPRQVPVIISRTVTQTDSTGSHQQQQQTIEQKRVSDGIRKWWWGLLIALALIWMIFNKLKKL